MLQQKKEKLLPAIKRTMAAKGLQLRTNALIKCSEAEEASSPSGSKCLQVSMEGHMDDAEKMNK